MAAIELRSGFTVVSFLEFVFYLSTTRVWICIGTTANQLLGHLVHLFVGEIVIESCLLSHPTCFLLCLLITSNPSGHCHADQLRGHGQQLFMLLAGEDLVAEGSHQRFVGSRRESAATEVAACCFGDQAADDCMYRNLGGQAGTNKRIANLVVDSPGDSIRNHIDSGLPQVFREAASLSRGL
ncbi:hypothetical protein HMPREF3289_23400 [Pseudomonas sp. HMSC75E02]|nr:hypothetical protein HMPREF3289_23400 [Pseudomonas sp. HMSC75E02]